MERTQDINVEQLVPLPAPGVLKVELPMTRLANRTVVSGRREVEEILTGADDRLLAIVGPCSIHDPAAAMEYARRLASLRGEADERICVLMRVYFEKPRTTVGWKGLIYDPGLDGSDDMRAGLRLARRLLLDIGELGLPTASEMLDPIVPQYIDDLVSWAAIGARTTESQTHREMASGLSMAVGFKNSTDGNLQVAVNAMESARHPHSFLGIDQEGRTAIVRTRGNPLGHVVLRGGGDGPNYEPEHIARSVAALERAGVRPVLVVDCSHANSGNEHLRQEEVWRSVVEQRAAGCSAIAGAMVESHLKEGHQPLRVGGVGLRYGVSITDACVDWDTTERMLRHALAQLGEGSVA